MMTRSLFSSVLFHVAFFSLLVFSGRFNSSLVPEIFIFDEFDYFKDEGSGNGKTGGSGLPIKLRGQVVPLPPKIQIPERMGPPQHETTPKTSWKIAPSKHPLVIPPPKSTSSEPGSKTLHEQTPIARIGVSPKTKPGNEGHLIGNGDDGIGEGLGVDIGDGEDDGFGFKSYLTLIRQRIWAEWSQSAIFGAGDQCTVGLTVAKDGRVSDIQLEKPSTHPTYDEFALRAVRNASPLPPLPLGFPKPNQRFRIQFKLME